MRRTIGLCVVAFLSACRTQEGATPLEATVTAAELRPFAAEGDRTIAGEAFLRQAGGGVVTCAGEMVTLLPAVPVVEEAVGIWQDGRAVDASDLDHADVAGSVRWVECDSRGRFAFHDLPAGTFHVMVPVRWEVMEEDQGGMLAEKVDVTHHSAERVIVDGDDALHEAEPWALTDQLN